MGTPRRKLADFERALLAGDWLSPADLGCASSFLSESTETFLLARSLPRARKESALLRIQLTRLHRSLRAGASRTSPKSSADSDDSEERYPQGWSMLGAVEHRGGRPIPTAAAVIVTAKSVTSRP